MQESRVASRYAKSLVELANERGQLEQVYGDMQLFLNVCNENVLLKKVLSNPVVGHDKKLGILEGIFSSRFSDISNAIFKLITQKNRENYLYFIAKEFIVQYKELKGIVSAEVTTTFPLTVEMRENFRSMIGNSQKKDVDLIEKIDEKIIGGYVLRVGDRQVDQSIKSKLQKLKSNFKDNSYISKL